MYVSVGVGVKEEHTWVCVTWVCIYVNISVNMDEEYVYVYAC